MTDQTPGQQQRFEGTKSYIATEDLKVAVNAASRTVSIEGPKGKTSFVYRPEVKVDFSEADKAIVVSSASADARSAPFRDARTTPPPPSASDCGPHTARSCDHRGRSPSLPGAAGRRPGARHSRGRR